MCLDDIRVWSFNSSYSLLIGSINYIRTKRSMWHRSKNVDAECLLVASCYELPMSIWWVPNKVSKFYFWLLQSSYDAGYIPLTESTQPSDNNYTRCSDPEQTQLEPPVTNQSQTFNVAGGTFTFHSDGQLYSYAYRPKGLCSLMHNCYMLLCAFFVSIGGLEFGYDQGIISSIWWVTMVLLTLDSESLDYQCVGN